MFKPTTQQREAFKSTTGKMEHITMNTFRFGSWVIVKCPNPNGTFNFAAKLGNAMTLTMDATEVDFMARLEAAGTK
jgi:hypothetical protein